MAESNTKPVVRIANQRVGGRRQRGDLDRVEGKRVCPAIRQIGLIDENHLHAPARQPQRRLQRGANVLDDFGEVSRECLETLMRMDVEVRGVKRAEAQPPSLPRRRLELSCGQEQGRDEDQKSDAAFNARSRQPYNTHLYEIGSRRSARDDARTGC